MSFQSVKYLLEKNKIELEPEIINNTPIEKSENPLLHQYKRQVERYQELLEELALWKKRQRKKETTLNKVTVLETEKKVQPNNNFFTHSNAFHTKESIIAFLKNAPDLDIAKKQIITYLYQEALDFNQIAQNSSSQKDYEECKKEILTILDQITWIQNYQIPSNDLVQTATPTLPKYHLIYLTSDTGRVIPYDEIDKEIPQEFYPILKDALLSLEQGILKGFKSLFKIKFNELKNQDTRIFFKQINENTFLILSCFVKNFKTNNKYKQDYNRLNDILTQKEQEYRSLANNDYYLEEQRKITDQIINLLSIKRGETNGQSLERTNTN